MEAVIIARCGRRIPRRIKKFTCRLKAARQLAAICTEGAATNRAGFAELRRSCTFRRPVLAKNHMIADLVAIIGSVDIVLETAMVVAISG
jgi:hypothetical protein